MNAQEIIALVTGLPAVIAAITALIWALRGKQSAEVAKGLSNAALNKVNYHIAQHHDQWPPQPKSMS